MSRWHAWVEDVFDRYEARITERFAVATRPGGKILLSDASRIMDEERDAVLAQLEEMLARVAAKDADLVAQIRVELEPILELFRRPARYLVEPN